MLFEGLLERHERGALSQIEAAEMLGISERSFRRWRDRLRDEGLRVWRTAERQELFLRKATVHCLK